MALADTAQLDHETFPSMHSSHPLRARAVGAPAQLSFGHVDEAPGQSAAEIARAILKACGAERKGAWTLAGEEAKQKQVMRISVAAQEQDGESSARYRMCMVAEMLPHVHCRRAAPSLALADALRPRRACAVHQLQPAPPRRRGVGTAGQPAGEARGQERQRPAAGPVPPLPGECAAASGTTSADARLCSSSRGVSLCAAHHTFR
jgi:hypothetical protein